MVKFIVMTKNGDHEVFGRLEAPNKIFLSFLNNIFRPGIVADIDNIEKLDDYIDLAIELLEKARLSVLEHSIRIKNEEYRHDEVSALMLTSNFTLFKINDFDNKIHYKTLLMKMVNKKITYFNGLPVFGVLSEFSIVYDENENDYIFTQTEAQSNILSYEDSRCYSSFPL